jgi:hypothetical protein
LKVSKLAVAGCLVWLASSRPGVKKLHPHNAIAIRDCVFYNFTIRNLVKGFETTKVGYFKTEVVRELQVKLHTFSIVSERGC